MSNIFGSIDTIHGYTALISIISLMFLYLPKCAPKRIPKWVPMPLFVIVAMVIVSWLLELENHGVSIVGNDIVTGYPYPGSGKVPLPNPKYFIDVIPGALVLAIVSYMGNIALAKGFDQKVREEYKEQLEKYNTYFNDEFITTPMNNTDAKQTKRKKTATTPLLCMFALFSFFFLFVCCVFYENAILCKIQWKGVKIQWN